MWIRNQISSHHPQLVWPIKFYADTSIFIPHECCRNFNYVHPLLWALMQSHWILILIPNWEIFPKWTSWLLIEHRSGWSRGLRGTGGDKWWGEGETEDRREGERRQVKLSCHSVVREVIHFLDCWIRKAGWFMDCRVSQSRHPSGGCGTESRWGQWCWYGE